MEFHVDSHVHVRSCFDEKRLIDSAISHLTATPNGQATIILTETATERVFEKWRDGNCPYPIEDPNDNLSISINKKLLVIGGQQIVTKEKLEVLSLFGKHSIPDGMTIGDTINAIRQRESIAVLPWGLGKWIGRRGQIVLETLRKWPSVLLGDNSGRPPFWKWPRNLTNRVILPGTDPLPAKCQNNLAGSYGFTITCSGSHSKPVELLRESLRSIKTRPSYLGKRQTLLQCAHSQLAMRL